MRKVMRVAKIIVLLAAWAGAARADNFIVKPIRAAASTAHSSCTILKAISGAGLTADLVTGAALPATYPAHTNDVNYMYMSAGIADPWMEFELGQNFRLVGFHLWNHNELGAEPGRSIKTATLQVKDAGGAYTTVTATASSYVAGTALNDYQGEEYLFATPVTGAYFKVNVITNYGPTLYTGISEIRFIGSIPAKQFIVQPVTAQASSEFTPGGYLATKAIDGSGLSSNLATGSSIPIGGYPVCDTAGVNTWLSWGQIPATNTFDLGAVYELVGFHLWNDNEITGRSISNAVVSVSESGPIDGSGYTAVSLTASEFAPSTASADYVGDDYIFTPPVKARFVRVAALSQWGTDGYVGISEIRFIARPQMPRGTVFIGR